MKSTKVARKSIRVRIQSESDATRALIEAGRIASNMKFGSQDKQTIATAVSELGRNILKYAGTGEVEIEEALTEQRVGIQITVRDKGPGIADLAAAMQDHFSSGGTLGLGLPGVKRMMDDFEIDSTPGEGTRVVIRKWRDRKPEAPRSTPPPSAIRPSQGAVLSGTLRGTAETGETGVDCSFFIRPCRLERVSGDAAFIDQKKDRVFVAIIDALGHGPRAHEIAERATHFLKQSWSGDILSTLQGLHAALKGTDGAAAGLCLLDTSTNTAQYVGIGNTVMRIFGSCEASAYSYAGTLGCQIRTPQKQAFGFKAGDVMVLCTDGVTERFDLDDYPQLRYESARKIANIIVNRFGKHHDDAGCIVLRYAS